MNADTLAGLRRRRELKLADLARLAGLTQQELWALEAGSLTSARLRDIAAYVRALGGRLELTATLDEGPVTLY